MADPLETELQAVALEPVTSSGDGQSATSHPLSELAKIADRSQVQSAAAGTNAQGGPRSPWGMMRPARAVTEGAG